ncbi:molybdenum cofactor guanylyltransferase MobA [Halotalea alkalilenta]|uniref:molybdenum cofactor guanylyltransferase MobA n=1 Tax=Halotalea alkalilenta TaxID=376489 RepID=UPI000693F29E|nr:molybdenum cofactor guanylyltransferase MobA [Halotalea alkalilenta]
MPATRSSVPAEPAARVEAVILAGGEGRRMGGVDKGLVEFAGRALVEHVLERLAPQVVGVSISANRSLSAYRAQAVGAVFGDRSECAGAGPLAGIDAALTRMRPGSEWLLVVPCDAPLLPIDLCARLLAVAQETTEVVYACDRKHCHPTVALLRRELAPRLRTALLEGVRRPLDFYAGCETRIAQFPDPIAFANLNTPAQLAELESMLRG